MLYSLHVELSGATKLDPCLSPLLKNVNLLSGYFFLKYFNDSH